MNRTRHFGPGLAAASAVPPPGAEALPRTALPVFRGTPRHLREHLERLEAGARAMGLPAAWVLELHGEIVAWLRSDGLLSDAALRMVLHPASALISASLEALPTPPQPCRLLTMPHPLGERRRDPLVVHKGLAGPWGRPVLGEARRRGGEDALLLWPDGTLAETAIASVAVETGSVLTLPPPCGRVASLSERLDLPGWAHAKGLRIQVADIPLDRVQEGRVWCLNALRGIWPATLL